MFSSVVTRHWIPEPDAEKPTDGEIRVVIDASLSPNRSVSLLRMADGPAVLTVTPERAGELSLSETCWVDPGRLAQSLVDAGITLNSPDHIFYLSLDEQAACQSERLHDQTRRLTVQDGAAFARFAGRAPVDDLAEAFVELDHWLVFGTFVDGDLVAAASMYPWAGTRLADLGVITLPGFRGQRLGRATVRAMSAAAIGDGYEPQYRCQVDNAASIALATSAGFTRFGDWEVTLD